VPERRTAEVVPTAKNVLGGPLARCGTDPMTGWTRSGCCETGPDDVGSHTVCAVVPEAFLRYSAAFGNDLSTPQAGFPGLEPGDRWCLCASRWQQAFEDGVAPPVLLEACHERALKLVQLEDLRALAVR
jgi:uncharacterized protein (DUF2237 family)